MLLGFVAVELNLIKRKRKNDKLGVILMVKTKALTKRQVDTLKRHGKHHSKKHMTEMKSAMKKGKTFTQAHKVAMKKVGK